MTSDVDPNEPRPINTPRLDLKIELARRRAEAERRSQAPFVANPQRFEKDDHKPDGTVTPR